MSQTAAAQSFEANVGYNVELDVFEGPLDLLLHLVKKHELDILDIPISFVTQKYLEYLDYMTALNLDVAGEYLLMAATLAYIKSRELLPAPDPLEEEDEDEQLDPRAELIRRLLEYQKYKQAADTLGGQPVVGRNVWTRGVPKREAMSEDVELDTLPPLKEFPVLKLIEALDRALSRAKIKLSHEVSIDRLSVAQCISRLTDRLETEQTFSFLSCFRFFDEELSVAQIKHEAVVTFLSILEMAKLGLIQVKQSETESGYDDEIMIAAAVSDVRARMAEARTLAGAIDDDYH